MIPTNIADQFYQCIKCGLCSATCPVCKELLLEKYTPRGKIQLARYHSQGELDLSGHCQDIFAKCLLCGSCVTTCPSGVDLNKVFVSMREEIAKKKGVHHKIEDLVRTIVLNHNISNEDNSDRAEWRGFLKNLPHHMYQKEKAKIIYFVGCVASFFPLAQKIPQNFVRILDSAGVDFTILGGEEWCCGFPLIGAGVPEKAREMMEHNLRIVKKLEAQTIVFSCPSCYRTWQESYHSDLELLHTTQLIEKLIANGSIRLGKADLRVTYHDPCDLGRKGGVYDAPRRILKSIPGLTFVELENKRAQSLCCGGGGNLEMVDSDLTETLAQKKIEEIERTGAKIVVTSCQQCVRTIATRAKRQEVDLNVWDITELVLKAMSQ
ncbi:MAG TPA: (Fe-S)-binding protein [Thermodesulfobacteriota bacterium]|jgi:heterodisulfide reductase subunit D|nr:(Fe-S)-binding protein [Thermodesulfobacteriota bacterium]